MSSPGLRQAPGYGGLATLVLVIVGLLMGGCTAANKAQSFKQSFALTAEDSQRPVVCQLTLPQKDVFVKPALVQKTSIQPLLTIGLVDNLFNIAAAGVANSWINASSEAENRDRRAAAENVGKPLVGNGLNDFFLSDFESKWSSAVRSSAWMRTSDLVVKAVQRAPTPEEINNGPILRMYAEYYLSGDSSTLIIGVTVQMFRRGSSDPAYRQAFLYYSDPIDSSKNGAAIKDWADNNFTLMKRTMQEGISRIISHIVDDFLDSGGRKEDAGRRAVRVEFLDAIDMRQKTVRGWLLSQVGTRVVVEGREGVIADLIAQGVEPDSSQ